MIRISSYLIFPIFFGAAAVAPEFITLAFGEKWDESGSIMTILAIGIAPIIVNLHINAALMASGRSRYVLLLAVSALIVNCIVGALSVPFGITAAAYGFAIRSYLIIGIYIFIFKYVFGTGFMNMLKTLAPTVLASACMLAVIMLSKPLLENHLAAALHILLLCVIGALTYTFLMITIFRSETKNFFIESIDIAPEKFKPYIKAIQRIIKLT